MADAKKGGLLGSKIDKGVTTATMLKFPSEVGVYTSPFDFLWFSLADQWQRVLLVAPNLTACRALGQADSVVVYKKSWAYATPLRYPEVAALLYGKGRKEFLGESGGLGKHVMCCASTLESRGSNFIPRWRFLSPLGAIFWGHSISCFLP